MDNVIFNYNKERLLNQGYVEIKDFSNYLIKDESVVKIINGKRMSKRKDGRFAMTRDDKKRVLKRIDKCL